MAATPETKVKDKVKLILDAAGARWVCPIGSAYGKSNMCDFIACIGGWFVEIEAKAAAYLKPSKLQDKALEATETAGGWAFVVHPDNLDDFLDFVADRLGIPASRMQDNVDALVATRAAAKRNRGKKVITLEDR